jgi:hypothetical protein
MFKQVVLALALTGCASGTFPPGTRNITDGMRNAVRNGGGYDLTPSNPGAIECVCVFDWEDNSPHAETERLLPRLRQECSGQTDPAIESLYSPLRLSSSQGLFVIFTKHRGTPGVEYQVFDRGEGRGSITTLWAAGCLAGTRATIRRIGNDYRYEVR